MKFPFARTALVLAASVSLASCGGGKATYPITVTIRNLTEPGLVLSTNGMDLPVTPPPATQTSLTVTFPNQIEYGQAFSVVPKGATLSGNTLQTYGTQPAHQTCKPSGEYPYNLLVYGTAGQLANIQVYYDCFVNGYNLGGTVSGLTADGLVLANGNFDTLTVASGATTFTMPNQVPYNTTFGVSVLTQPPGLTCSVSGGNGTANNGSGIMDDAASKLGGVTNLVVNCVPKS
jgi:hypothetical protein